MERMAQAIAEALKVLNPARAAPGAALCDTQPLQAPRDNCDNCPDNRDKCPDNRDTFAPPAP